MIDKSMLLPAKLKLMRGISRDVRTNYRTQKDAAAQAQYLAS